MNTRFYRFQSPVQNEREDVKFNPPAGEAKELLQKKVQTAVAPSLISQKDEKEQKLPTFKQNDKWG